MKFITVVVFFLLTTIAHGQFATPCTETPELNQQILQVLNPYVGKKIGRGECWDAAKLALETVGAEWDGLYVFGRAIDVKKECIQPGDIIQFEKVEVRTEFPDGRITVETFGHHTSIVYSVKPGGNLELLHQNTGYTGRKMGITALNLAGITKGKYIVYRPVN